MTNATLPTIDTMTATLVGLVNNATPAQVAAGVKWYDAAREFCHELSVTFGYTLPQVAAVVAALSPRTPWAVNKTWALQIVAAHAMGKEVPSVGTTANRNKAWQALGSEWPETFASGPKVSQFYMNILGDESRVTVDVWAYFAATGVKLAATTSVQKREFAPITAAYVAAANILGLTPSAVQAITWGIVRGSAE